MINFGYSFREESGPILGLLARSCGAGEIFGAKMD